MKNREQSITIEKLRDRFLNRQVYQFLIRISRLPSPMERTKTKTKNK